MIKPTNYKCVECGETYVCEGGNGGFDQKVNRYTCATCGIEFMVSCRPCCQRVKVEELGADKQQFIVKYVRELQEHGRKKIILCGAERIFGAERIGGEVPHVPGVYWTAESGKIL